MNDLFSAFRRLFSLEYGIKYKRLYFEGAHVEDCGEDRYGHHQYRYVFSVSKNNQKPAAKTSRHPTRETGLTEALTKAIHHNQAIKRQRQHQALGGRPRSDKRDAPWVRQEFKHPNVQVSKPLVKYNGPDFDHSRSDPRPNAISHYLNQAQRNTLNRIFH